MIHNDSTMGGCLEKQVLVELHIFQGSRKKWIIEEQIKSNSAKSQPTGIGECRMKSITIIAMVMLFVLHTPLINPTTSGIPGIGAGQAEAGPLSSRLESKHEPSPHSKSNMQGIQSEMQKSGDQMQGGLDANREKCIEMLHKGDHEGAQKCIEQLQGGDSGKTQPPAAESQQVQLSSQSSGSSSDVQGAPSGTQDANDEALGTCAEMLRSGDHVGARRCIQQLRK